MPVAVVSLVIEATTVSRTKFRLSEPAPAPPWAPAAPTATLTSSDVTSTGIADCVYPRLSVSCWSRGAPAAAQRLLQQSVSTRGHLGTADRGAGLVLVARGRRARLVRQIRVGRLEAAADVVVRNRAAACVPVSADRQRAGDDDHQCRLDRKHADRSLGLDCRVINVRVDIIGDRVDGDRAARRNPLTGPGHARGDRDQLGAGFARDIKVAAGRHNGIVDVRRDGVLDQVVADRGADRVPLARLRSRPPPYRLSTCRLPRRSRFRPR